MTVFDYGGSRQHHEVLATFLTDVEEGVRTWWQAQGTTVINSTESSELVEPVPYHIPTSGRPRRVPAH